MLTTIILQASMSFWVTTRGSYKTACLHLGLGKHAKTLVLNLSELKYLNYIMCIAANQLARYSGAMVDVELFVIGHGF
jgi:hypothetical protein